MRKLVSDTPRRYLITPVVGILRTDSFIVRSVRSKYVLFLYSLLNIPGSEGLEIYFLTINHNITSVHPV